MGIVASWNFAEIGAGEEQQRLRIATDAASRPGFVNATARGQRNAIYWNNPRNHREQVMETFCAADVYLEDTNNILLIFYQLFSLNSRFKNGKIAQKQVKNIYTPINCTMVLFGTGR